MEKADLKEETPGTGCDAIHAESSDEICGLPARIQRYSKARERAIEMSAFLGAQSETRLQAALDDCGNWLVFRHYFTVGKVRLTRASFCRKHLLCPLCAIRRGAKQLSAYLQKFQTIRADRPDLKISLVTLTVKNGPDLAERFDHLLDGVKRLNQRRRNSKRGKTNWSEWSKVLGIVGTYEVTNRGNGWHPHTHALVLHVEDIDCKALAREWFEITEDSHQVDVAPILNMEDPAKDFCEVFKYAVKFSDLSVPDHFEAFKALTGRRLIYSAGLFRGVVIPPDLQDEPLDGLPYVELLYSYLGEAGYSLSSFKTPAF